MVIPALNRSRIMKIPDPSSSLYQQSLILIPVVPYPKNPLFQQLLIPAGMGSQQLLFLIIFLIPAFPDPSSLPTPQSWGSPPHWGLGLFRQLWVGVQSCLGWENLGTSMLGEGDGACPFQVGSAPFPCHPLGSSTAIIGILGIWGSRLCPGFDNWDLGQQAVPWL